MMSPPGPRSVVDGVEHDYFGGTNYLGLHGHPEVLTAASRAIRSFGVHTATSRSRFSSQPILDAEQAASQFFGSEDAYYFASGYMGASIMAHALRDSVDAVFLDAASHYCLAEAALITGVPVHSFATRDPESLHLALQEHLKAGGNPLVMTDGVFPSSGHIAPVEAYTRILEGYLGSALLLDDAHGFGVLGEHGRGTLEHFDLWSGVNHSLHGPGPRKFVVGTTAKALGGFGGIIPGSAGFIEALRLASHHFDGASAPPIPAAAATAVGLNLAHTQPELRDQLRENTHKVQAGLREMGIDVANQPTPVVGFTCGDAAAMQHLHDSLAAARILVPYAPTYSDLGPGGALRIAVFANHEDSAIDRLIAELQQLIATTN